MMKTIVTKKTGIKRIHEVTINLITIETIELEINIKTIQVIKIHRKMKKKTRTMRIEIQEDVEEDKGKNNYFSI